jgi:TrmH family RNA methyltransferase
VITSRDNGRLRLVRKLADQRWREKLGLFVVEGEDLVEAASTQPVDVLRSDVDVEPRLLASAVSAAHPPRVVAVFRRADLPAWERRPASLALWRVGDPGNVGTLIRTADAFGASVCLSEGCADPTSPKALRATVGSIWRVPVGDWAGLDSSRNRVALVAHGGVPLRDVDLTGEVAFLLGAEREGLPDDVARDVEATISIGRAESLNVAAAGAIALYERWRQLA